MLCDIALQIDGYRPNMRNSRAMNQNLSIKLRLTVHILALFP